MPPYGYYKCRVNHAGAFNIALLNLDWKPQTKDTVTGIKFKRLDSQISSYQEDLFI